MRISELSTSEGRMTLLLNVISIYSAIHGFIPANVTAWLATASVGIYAISRALVKVGEAIAPLTKSVKDDKIVAEAKAIIDTIAPIK